MRIEAFYKWKRSLSVCFSVVFLNIYITLVTCGEECIYKKHATLLNENKFEQINNQTNNIVFYLDFIWINFFFTISHRVKWEATWVELYYLSFTIVLYHGKLTLFMIFHLFWDSNSAPLLTYSTYTNFDGVTIWEIHINSLKFHNYEDFYLPYDLISITYKGLPNLLNWKLDLILI